MPPRPPPSSRRPLPTSTSGSAQRRHGWDPRQALYQQTLLLMPPCRAPGSPCRTAPAAAVDAS